MQSLKSRLPGLNALLTFEAAARHLSFTRAADELCVSQAAVSRQVQRLEERLGQPLFVRRHRALELTGSGSELQRAVTLGLGHIADAMRGLEGTTGRQIQVATTVAFATYWFAPRLGRFRNAFPDADVRVLASDSDRDHLADDIDLALVCGRRDLPGWRMTALFPEVVFPVCSPAFLEKHPLTRLEQLTDLPLLHLDPRHREDVGWTPVDWTLWLGRFGIEYRPRHPTVTYNNYPMLVEAALAGEAVALGWQHLAERMLAEGRLLRPLAESCEFERRYYLALHDRGRHSPELEALHEALLRESRETAGRGVPTQSSGTL